MSTLVVNSFSLIDVNGKFNEGIQKDLKLDDENSPLAVVSIIGAQSSGKSTLLNHLFRTEFEEMDARGGRRQTTKGIWVAKKSLEKCCILVIDTEGSDGREREGKETFARQSAVFAMAISHVVIINMMCTDIGRESGGGWPLLRTACEVMLQRFMKPHRVTLVFVLRDKTNSPLEALESQIMEEMGKILEKITRPQAQENALLSQLFNQIKVVATSHYLIDSERPKFIAEVKELRDWIISQTASIESTSECIPTYSFTTYAREIWDKIKEDKDLDLPSYRIMAAQVHCDRIAKEQCDNFRKDEKWLKIKENMESGSIIQGFGKDVGDLISTHLSQYGENAILHDKTTTDERGKQLTAELLEIIEPTYLCLVERMRNKTREDFKKAALDQLKNDGTLKGVEVQDFINQFDHQVKDACIKQADWTHASKQRDTLQSDVNDFKEAVEAFNAVLDQHKEDKQSAWVSVLSGLASGVLGNWFGSLMKAPVRNAIVPYAIKLLKLLT